MPPVAYLYFKYHAGSANIAVKIKTKQSAHQAKSYNLTCVNYKWPKTKIINLWRTLAEVENIFAPDSAIVQHEFELVLTVAGRERFALTAQVNAGESGEIIKEFGE